MSNDIHAGPAGLKGNGEVSNTTLDPVITDYSRLNPWNDSIVSPESKQWDLIIPPSQIVESIKEVHMSCKDKDIVLVKTKPAQAGKTPRDVIYCFEGCTGMVEDRHLIGNNTTTKGAYSMMGFVLMRYSSNDPNDQHYHDYQVHVIFRGSRSGSAARAAAQGLVGERGNPDWTTNMDSAFTKSPSKDISTVGSVAFGFKNSLMSALPTLWKCLGEIAKANPGKAPSNIYISGHSLGGALAALFAISIRKGNGLQRLKQLNSISWDLDKISQILITYSAPTIGSKDLVNPLNIGAPMSCYRVHVKGDPVTTDLIVGNHIGVDIKLGRSLKGINTERHNPYFVRNAIIDASKVYMPELDRSLPIIDPWVKYKSFYDALKRIDHANGLDLLLPDFHISLSLYIRILKQCIEDYMPNDNAVAAVKRLRSGFGFAINDADNKNPKFDPKKISEWNTIEQDCKLAWNDVDFERFMLVCYLLLRYSQSNIDPQLRQKLAKLVKDKKEDLEMI